MRAEHWLYTLPLRLRSLFRRRQVEQELDEELRFHIDRQTETLVAAGMSPSDARSQALRAMGSIEQRKDECRDTRRVSLVDGLVRDVRYALRTLRRSPGFTIVAILMLTIGIGANTAIFTVVNAVLLRPLEYTNPSELVFLRPGNANTIAPASYIDWRLANRSFSEMGIAEYWTPNLTGRDRPEEVQAIHVSASLLSMYGVRPLIGRVFLPEEEHAGRQRVVVLRYDTWRSRFGGDPQVLGQTMTLDGEPYMIVGVMPQGFRFAAFWNTEAGFAAPLVLDGKLADRTGASLRAFGRLRPGVTMARAKAELASVARQAAKANAEVDPEATVDRLQDVVVGDVRRALIVLLAAVGFVLLIACANVAHLQLLRSAAREREFTVRTALGASRSRLIQQSLVESTLLSLAGGVLGLLLAQVGVKLLTALGPASLPRLDTISMDARVYLFMLVATLGAGLLFGIAPALAGSRVDVHGGLKEGARSGSESRRRRRVRGTLVVSEFAMALVLLVGAGLVLRSFVALLHVDGGYDPRNVLSMVVSVQGTPHADVERRTQFFRDVVEHVSTVPGVVSASATNHLPLHGDNWRFEFAVEGRPASPPGKEPSALFRVARTGYFRTMRIPVLAGRDFSVDDEAQGARVVIINQHMARLHWPNDSPIGQRIAAGDPARHPDWFTVIGVVQDIRQSDWTAPSTEEMYFPTQMSADVGSPESLFGFLHPKSMTIVVRSSSNPAGLTRAVQEIVQSIDRDAAVSDVITMEAAIGEQVASPRFYMLLFGIFAGVALVLAAVGVYGVISYSAARRTHEIGLRLALGADQREAFRLIVGEGMRLAAIGGLAGLIVAFGVTRFLRSQLYEVQPTDPATFAIVTLVLALVAFAACFIPARRASRVNPTVALRNQ